VHFPDGWRGGRPVSRRADQRMPEPYPGAELRQPCRRRRSGRRRVKADPPGGPPYQRHVAGRVGRRQLHQPPGLVGKCLDLPTEAVFDPLVQRSRAGKPEPAGQLTRRQSPGQLQKRQRVPVRVRDDLLQDLLIQRSGQRRLQQRPRVTLGQACHGQLRQPRHVRARDPGREHHAHRVGRQPPRGEPQRLRRGPVQPLLVIDHADQRPLSGRLRQQPQYGQAHQEPIRCRAVGQAQRSLQRLSLRSRK
jgi:hypothetical protein